MVQFRSIAPAVLAVAVALSLVACTQKNRPATGGQAISTQAQATAAASGSAQGGTDGSGSSASPAVAATSTTSGGITTATRSSAAPGSAVDVVKTLRPSIVRVRTQGSQTGPFGQVGLASGVGTGIIVDTDGHIVTNNHVVTLGTTQVAGNFTVDLADGRSLSATLVGRDPSSDLAVLKVSDQNLTPAKFADPNSLQVGQDVVAIGYALDIAGDPTVTKGVISALHRDFTETLGNSAVTIGDMIQTDAAINEGNSGGPLSNLNGEVVGINTGALRPSGNGFSSQAQVQGINYAISVQTIQPVVKSLISKGNVDHGYLGVNISQLDRNTAAAQKLPVSDGVIISQVVRGGPADKAGLQSGDIIVKAGNQVVHTLGDLSQALIETGPGSKLHIEYYRGNNRQSADVTLGSRPAGT